MIKNNENEKNNGDESNRRRIEIGQRYPKMTEALLLIIGVAFGCACLALLVNPFIGKSTTSTFLPKNSIDSTSTVSTTLEDPTANDHLFSNFRKMMDSLRIFDPSSYEKLLKRGGNLLDSLSE